MRAKRNRGTLLGMAVTVGLLVSVVSVMTAVPSLANAISMGPEAMEGNLLVSPGDTIKAGYSLKMDGQHPAATVSLLNAKVTFDVECADNPGVIVGTITVALSSGPYDLPQNDSAWRPTNDKDDPSSYLGSALAPNLCGGGVMSLRRGGTFTTDLTSTDTDKVILRFHYSANGSPGAWSRSEDFAPDTNSVVPVGTIGVFGLVVLIALAFAVQQRRAAPPARASV